MELIQLNPILNFIITILAITLSASSLSIFESHKIDRGITEIIFSKLRYLLLELRQDSTLKKLFHLLMFFGFILVALVGDLYDYNSLIGLVSLLLLIPFTYEIISREEIHSNAEFSKKVIRSLLIISSFALINSSEFALSLGAALLCLFLIAGAATPIANTSHWIPRSNEKVLTNITMEFLFFSVSLISIVKHLKLKEPTLEFLAALIFSFVASLVLRPLMAGSILKRSDSKKITQKVTLLYLLVLTAIAIVILRDNL